MNLLLDFDGTCSGGHSKGRVFNESVPMDKENQLLFINAVNTWLTAGHNVAIITRAIGTKIGPHFTNILGIPFIADGFQQGMVSIFAPDEDTFNAHPEAGFWADEKLLYVKRFLDCSESSGRKTIFVDDTLINVTKMQSEFPDMKCVHVAKFGDYQFTFQTVNEFLTDSATINYT